MGNPKGDVTIVEYFDYQCPYCKKTVPELAQLAKEDGNIRLVLKDWPIFGDVSVAAAELALASKYQNKYAEAHAILIGATSKLTETNIPICLRRPVSMSRWQRPTWKPIKKSIEDLLARNQRPSRGLRISGHAGLHRRHFPDTRRRWR